MENVSITEKEITWERTKKRFNSEIKYKSKALNHGDVISIQTQIFVDGKIVNDDLTHLPIELIDKMKDLREV